MKKKRIVITGVGLATSEGIGIDEFKHNYFCSDDNQRHVSHLDEIAEQYVDYSDCRRMDNYSKYGLVAAKLALINSGLEMKRVDKTRIGLILSTIWGPVLTTTHYFRSLLEKGPTKAPPLLFPSTVTNVVIGKVARLLELRGVSSMLVGWCPIKYAYELLLSNKADIVLAGGVENIPEDLMTASSGNKILNGSCVIVLETLEHALNRGANIIAEIDNVQTGFIHDQSSTEKQSQILTRVMQNALCQLERSTENIDGVVSLSTGNHHHLNHIETDIIQKLNLIKIQPFFDNKKLFSLSSCVNVFAALFKIHLPIKAKIILKNFLVNSFFYGGNVNSLLIKDY